MHTDPGTSRQRQRGAIAILTAAFIVAAVALIALAVDTGRLYAAQQKLQSTANLAALAAARQASGCRSDLGMGDGAEAAATTLARNYAGRGEDAMPRVSRYDQGFVTTNPTTGLRDFNTGGAADARPDGVRLTITDDGFKPLFSLFVDQTTTLSASAGALSQPQAGLRFGTTLAEVDPTLLDDLLGDLAVASVGDLATAQVSLADLLNINAGVVTRDDLATITVNEALGNVSGLVNALARGVIGPVREALGDQPLSAVLDLAGPVGSDTSLALGSLVNSAAQLVAAERHTAIPLTVDLSLPAGLGNIAVGLRLLQPAGLKIGPAGTDDSGRYYTQVRSAQVSLQLDLLLEIDLGEANLLSVDLPVAVKLAQGEARLERIDCPRPSDRAYTVVVSVDTALAEAKIGRLGSEGGIDANETGSVTILGNICADLFNVEEGACRVAEVSNANGEPSTLFARADQRVVFDGIDDLDRLQIVDDGDVGLRTDEIAGLLGNLNPELKSLGGLPTDPVDALLNDALSDVTDLLQRLSKAALAPVLDPILESLGVSLAAPSITLTTLEPNQPELFCASAADCGFVSAAP